jgi:two-component system LytT family response regulator
MKGTIRTLIVDDEPLSRERLRSLLAEEPDVEIVGECGDGCQAVLAIEELRPDLVFLDVQVPNLDGFHILESVGADRIPAVVFVTAYDQYALRAFDVRAVDYVLKPFGRERLQKALEYARAQITREKSSDLSGQIVALLEEMRPPQYRYLKRIMIKESGRLFFLRTPDIDWVEASGNYVRLHVGAESHLLRETMNGLEGRLDPERFLRIHRSTIVNIERIKELQPWFHGDYVVILRDDRQLTMSATYREKLDELRGRTLAS